ncbi:MAG: MFS transporter [Gammaproteobacteria bacterium]|nr:MFS transporter [Gammaproteobacteria bacterium]
MNNKNTTASLPWLIFFLGVSFYAISYLLQVSPSVMKHELMLEFSIGAATFGNLAAFFFYSYGFMQLPVGMLLDRFGIRKSLTIAILICIGGCLLFAIADSVILANIGRLLMGIGCAFAPIACLTIINHWFPKNRFALLAGLMLTIGMLGAVAGEAPLSMIIKEMGWRHSIWSLAIICVILASTVWLIVKDKPYHKTEKKYPVFGGLKSVLFNKQTWLISFYAGFMFVAVLGFGGLWGTSYLMKAYPMSQATSASIISLIFIGFAMGSPFFGWLSDYVHRRKLPMYIGTLGALITILMVIYLPHLPYLSLRLLMLAIGFFSSGFTTALATVKEVNKPEVSATSLGIMNLFNTFLGAAPQPIIGLILDYSWEGGVHQGVREFTLQNYHQALLIIPGAFLISLIILPFIKETFCKQLESY